MAQIVEHWPELPQALRAHVVALVRLAARSGSRRPDDDDFPPATPEDSPTLTRAD